MNATLGLSVGMLQKGTVDASGTIDVFGIRKINKSSAELACR